MSLSKRPYKGTRDFFPAEKRIQEYLFEKMRKTALSYGYESYDGPLIEEVELYKAKSGEELINEQIYSFMDRGNRFVSIRPEMTPTLARMVAQVYREVPRPIRWFSIPNLMRYEKPQKGRLREHWQLNCDIFGAPENLGEIEILQVGTSLFKNLGADERHFEVLINDRRIVDYLFEELIKCGDSERYRLYKIIDKSKKISFEDVKKMVKELSLDKKGEEIFFEYLKLKSFADMTQFLSKYSFTEAIKDRFANFISKLENLGMLKFVSYDPTIVRGLDYYTGFVFEFYDKHPDNRRALCGGGAYANLLQIFNEGPLPGVGFGLGDVTLKDFLSSHNLLPDLSKGAIDIYVTFQDEKGMEKAFILCERLRDEGLKVSLGLTPIKINKAISMGVKKGARYVGLMGSQEIEEGLISIKDLNSKEQRSFKLSEIKREDII